MGLFDFIKQELQLANISRKDINSRKHKELREELVRRAFTREIETSDLKKTALIAKVRREVKAETGIKFSNELARKSYNDLKGIKNKSYYASKLKADVKPSDEKIPLIEYSIKDQYLYGFKFYSYDSKIKKKKSLPRKSIIRLNDGQYNVIKDYVFFSELKLTKKQAIETIIKTIYDIGNTDSQQFIEGSDYQLIFKSNLKIIGIKYDRLLRT